MTPASTGPAAHEAQTPSQLRQWPVQIKLAPLNAPYFQSADLLEPQTAPRSPTAPFTPISCTGNVTLIGCPKLDDVDYAKKLIAILAGNDIASVTIARMSVLCCGGLEYAVRAAIDAC